VSADDSAPVGFRPVAQERPTLPRRPRPTGNPAYICFAEPDSPAIEVFLERKVLRQMREITEQAAPYEAIGLLAGRACLDGQGLFTVIETVEPARAHESEAGVGRVQLSGAGGAAIRRRLAYRFPVGDVLGWFHSHPKSRPIFSFEDRQEQATWPEPYNVGVVVGLDESVRTIGVYTGPRALKLERTRNVSMPVPCPLAATEPSADSAGAASGRPAPRRSRRVLVAAALLIAAVGALAVLFGLRRDGGPLRHGSRVGPPASPQSWFGPPRSHHFDAFDPEWRRRR
jgi:proteasome lid subunit RPN8/RPN11